MKTSIFLLAFLMALGIPDAGAKTWTVTSNADSGPNSLRSMLARAGDGDNVHFALPSGYEVISLNSDITIQGKSVSIDGRNTGEGSGYPVTVQVVEPGHSPYRVFTLDPGYRRSVSLMNMQIRGGDVSGSSTSPDGGVILLRIDGALILSRCVVRDGRARNGGGIYAGGVFNRGSLVLKDCEVTENAAVADYVESCGGGLYAAFGTTIINTTRIHANTSQSHSGGFYLFNATGKINNSSIYGNKVREGTANEGSFCGPSLTIIQSFITNMSSSTIAEKYPKQAVSRQVEGEADPVNASAAAGVKKKALQNIPQTLALVMRSVAQH